MLESTDFEIGGRLIRQQTFKSLISIAARSRKMKNYRDRYRGPPHIRLQNSSI